MSYLGYAEAIPEIVSVTMRAHPNRYADDPATVTRVVKGAWWKHYSATQRSGLKDFFDVVDAAMRLFERPHR